MNKTTMILGLGAVGLLFWAEASLILEQKTSVITSLPTLAVKQASPPSKHLLINQPPLLEYLAGTDIDGHLALDNQGNLILDQGLLDFIDYHLSTLGRLNEDAVINELQRQIIQHLEEPARHQALNFLDLYQKYGREYADLAETKASWLQQGMTYEAIDHSLNTRQQLRQDIFGLETANDLWQQEDIYDQKVLSNIQLKQNNEQHLVNTHGIPSAFKEANDLSQLSNHLQKQEQHLKSNNAHSAEIYQLRAMTLGPNAANRLGKLDSKIQNWKKRIEEYLESKKSIESDAGDSHHNKTQKVLTLKKTLFNASEQKRLLAYELHPALLEQY